MHICVDVAYNGSTATAAGVLFSDWCDPAPLEEKIVQTAVAAPYVPGRFYLRELPCILDLVRKLDKPPSTIIIDGYVWLDDGCSPGLGGHLFDSLERRIPVIGVAKSKFATASSDREILRGKSRRPLFITSAGISTIIASEKIASMHGPFRVPTLLKYVDCLTRSKFIEGISVH